MWSLTWQAGWCRPSLSRSLSVSRADPYSIPTCDHHLKNPKIQPCGAEGPTPQCTQQCVDGETWANTKSFGQAPYSLDMTTVYQEIMLHGSIESSFSGVCVCGTGLGMTCIALAVACGR